MFFTGFISLIVLLHFPLRSPSSSLCTVFDAVSSKIGGVLSVNPPAVFVCRGCNVHHKDWLTYSGKTGKTGELCYNFSISNDLNQMVNFLSQIPDCVFHSPCLLDLFLSSDTSICSMEAFPPSGNPDHVVDSVSIDFLSNSTRDAYFITYLLTILVLVGTVFMIIWEIFCGRVFLNSVLLLLLVHFVSGFRLESMCISLIINVRQRLTHLHDFQLLLLLQ